jgi:hypothetical protein
VDLVVERDDGAVLAFEVKAAGRVPGGEFGPLRKLRGAVGDPFMAGVVLYTGTRSYMREALSGPTTPATKAFLQTLVARVEFHDGRRIKPVLRLPMTPPGPTGQAALVGMKNSAGTTKGAGTRTVVRTEQPLVEVAGVEPASPGIQRSWSEAKKHL